MELLLIRQYPDVQTAAEARKLPELQQQQILSALSSYFGRKATLVGSFRGGECVMNGFRVVDAAQPTVVLYDYWETNADSGSVFQHGTTQRAGVQRMQFDFEAVPRTPATEALAEAMHRAKRVPAV